MLGEWEGKALLFLALLFLAVLATWPILGFRNKALKGEIRNVIDDNQAEIQYSQARLAVEECRTLEASTRNVAQLINVAQLYRNVINDRNQAKEGEEAGGRGREARRQSPPSTSVNYLLT